MPLMMFSTLARFAWRLSPSSRVQSWFDPAPLGLAPVDAWLAGDRGAVVVHLVKVCQGRAGHGSVWEVICSGALLQGSFTLYGCP